MSSAFDQQIGAAGDVRELEYISALHQTTTEEVRRDASIKAEDIQRFLMSRYGIKATEEEVRLTILHGLGGGSDDDDVLDLMEVVAMLLIPIFLKASRKDCLYGICAGQKQQQQQADCSDEAEEILIGGSISGFDDEQRRQSSASGTATGNRTARRSSSASTSRSPSSATAATKSSFNMEAREDGLIPTPPGLIDFVLKMILHDVTGDKKPKRLTKDLIRRILISHGEISLANDNELVEEMYEAATSFDAEPLNKGSSDGGTGTTGTTTTTMQMLDTEAFATALTHDIQLYDIRNEYRLTTNFDDVYVTDETLQQREEEMFATSTTSSEFIRKHRENQTLRAKMSISENIERVNTIPFIDTTAGTYRSKGLLVLLWATILITYFAYYIDLRYDWNETFCAEEELAYMYNSPWSENFEAILCESFFSIVRWMYFFFGFSVFGVVCVYFGSIGNAVDGKSVWKPVMSGIFVLLLVVVPYVVMEDKKADLENNVLYLASLVFGLLACAFCLYRASELYLSDLQMKEFWSYLPKFDHPIFRSTVSEERSVKQATARKLSQMTRNALKINKLKSPDSILHTHYGQALKSYETESRNPANIVSAGGFLWTWKKLLGKGDEFAKVGVWIPARMISSNLAQYVVAVYIIVGGIDITLYLEQEYDVEFAKRHFDMYVNRAFMLEGAESDEIVDAAVANATSLLGQYLEDASSRGVVDLKCGDSESGTTPLEFLERYCDGDEMGRITCDQQSTDLNYLCPLADPAFREGAGGLNTTSRLALLNASGFSVSLLSGAVAGTAQEAARSSLDSLYPSEKYMVTVPMYIATILAFIVSLSLAIGYIPSVTTTILKLRNGHIATLRNKDFNRYRCAPDQVALLTGSLFWGSLFSGVVVGGFVGLIVFFFLWQASVYYAQRAVAILAGIISVTLMRLAIVCTCRCLLWNSFYRVKPGTANIGILALEWGNFALSAGYILARSLKLLLAAATFIGRIDTPFLAHNVGRIGPLELDNYPIVHMKDVLTHEAHRHPYIEQLGVIYLMKLRYRKHFGKRAGTAWRMIFVYALMPWLHRYRILARHDETTHALNDEKDSEDPASDAALQYMSLKNLHTANFTSEEDDNQAQAVAMWQMKTKAIRGLDTYHRRRSQELEEECEQLRFSLSEAGATRIQELEDEVRQLREALAKATNQPLPASEANPEYNKNQPAATKGEQHTKDEGFDSPSLFDLQPIAPPVDRQTGVPSADPREIATNSSLLLNDSVHM